MKSTLNLFIFRKPFYFDFGEGSNQLMRLWRRSETYKRRLSADRSNLLKAFILAAFWLPCAPDIVSIFGYTYPQKTKCPHSLSLLPPFEEFSFEKRFVKDIFIHGWDIL